MPLLNRLVREKLQSAAETVMAEGWKWVEVDAEFDYQRVAAMSTIDTVPRELSAEDQKNLEALQERLENLSNEAEQDDPIEEVLNEIERLEQQIAVLTEEVFRPEDIVRAGVFIALGHVGEARIERGYLRPEDELPEEGEGEEGGEGKTAPQASTDTDGLSAALVAELTGIGRQRCRTISRRLPSLH